MKGIHYYLLFLTENSEDDFCFYGKRQKAEIAVSHNRGRAHPEQQEWCHQAPSPGLHSASQHPAARALNHVSMWALPQLILCIG